MFRATRKRLRRFDSRSDRRDAKPGQRARPRRLGLEALEARQMLSAAPLQLVSHAAGSTSSGDRASFIEQYSTIPQDYTPHVASQQTVVSQDGRYVAFVSDATNLVSGAAFSGAYDVFRYDRHTGNIDLVSVNTTGTGGGNSDSGDPVISADGSVVAFLSSANNLSALDANGSTQEVFSRDFRTNTTSLLSVDFTGTGSGNGASYRPAISADGRVVAFVSDASNLSPLLDTVIGPPNLSLHRQVFARNLATGTTSLVSVDSAGTGTGNAWSGDGGIYYTGISNGGDGSTGNQPPPSSIFDGTPPAISADGSVIAFASASSNLVSGIITNGFGTANVYARNLNTGSTTLLSGWLAPANERSRFGGVLFGGDGDSLNPVISANGNVVAYQSFANGPTDFGLAASNFANIFTDNLSSGSALQLTNGNNNSVNPVLSADGSVVAYQSSARNLPTAVPDSSGTLNVYAWSLATGTSLLSVNSAGTSSGNGDSDFPKISADGTVVVFDSYASDLAPLDTNRTFDQYGDVFGDDVFARNLRNGTTTLVSMNAAGAASGNGNSSNAVLSADGKTVAFTSDASNLVDGDLNGFPDVFLADLNSQSLQIGVDGGGNLVIGDRNIFAKDDNLKIGYDGGTGQIVIQDLTGNPIHSTVGAGDGTSTLSVSPSSFTGNVIFNSGGGNDRLTVGESFAGSGKGIQFDGGAGNDALAVVGAGGSATFAPTASGAGSIVIDGSTAVNFADLEAADISGMSTATVASPAASANTFVLNPGLDSASSTLPAIVVSTGLGTSAQLFNNTNLIIDTSATTGGPGSNQVVVGSAIGLGHGNTNVTLRTNANGSVEFNADLLAAGAVTVDTPTVFLNAALNLIGKTTTAATTVFNVARSGSIQNAIDLATTGDTINVAGATYPGPLHLNKAVSLQLSQGVVITLPAGATSADIQSTIAVLQGSTAAGAPQVVLPVAGANLTAAINSVPALNLNATRVEILLLVSGTAANYNVADKLLTVAFVNGPSVSQQPDELNPGQRKLVVTGTAGNDTIAFKEKADGVKVEIAGYPTGSFLPTGRLVAFGLGGDDVIDASNSIHLSAWLYGGDGNDTLKGGGGNDMLQGGAGNDTLSGCGGRDLLIGGTGSDQVGGNGGEDILISGTTAFDANDIALLGILNEWSSGRTFAQRVSNLMGTGTGATFAARLNGNNFLNADSARGAITVLDDNAQDSLKGGAGADLYFANLVLDAGDQATQTDQIIGLKKNEVAVDTDFLPPPDIGP